MSRSSNQSRTTTGKAKWSDAKFGALMGAITGIAAAVVTGAVSLGVGWLQFSGGDQAKDESPVPTPTAQTAPAVQRIITSPQENQLVPVTCEVRGTVTNLPDDKSLVVASREGADGRMFFEQDVSRDANGQWRAKISLGDPRLPKESDDQKFEVYAVVMDKAWATYLSRTGTAEPNSTYWSTDGIPPGASLGAPRQVQRSEKTGKC